MNWETYLGIAPFDWLSVFTALFCSTLIGLERQHRGKPLGVRTAAMISLGTYLFVAGALSIQTGQSDPLRIIGQVITGIGFLGAGVILKNNGAIIGVTSAATIWALASISVVIALGHRLTALKLSFLVILLLPGIDWLEKKIHSLSKENHQEEN